MKRIIETYGKNGVLEIAGNPQETILYLRGKPIQYSWYAEVGSTWRFHIAQGLNSQAINLNNGMEELLKRGIENEGDFLAVTEYFNKFLKYGKYEYGYYEIDGNVGCMEIPQDKSYQSSDSYGGCLEMTPTQNYINDELVDEYKEQILRGKRPVTILLHVENSWMFYILDGHHKFYGYRKANIKPHAVIITKLENKYKPIEETIELAKSMQCTNQNYLNWMKREKKNLQYYENHRLDLEKKFKIIKK